MYLLRWDIEPMGGLRIGVYRLDRWSGNIELCYAVAADRLLEYPHLRQSVLDA